MFEGSQCEIDQCNKNHSQYHKCANGTCIIDPSNGSAYCNCDGTNFYGSKCENPIDSNYVKTCLDSNYKIISDNKCNNLDTNAKVNLCKIKVEIM